MSKYSELEGMRLHGLEQPCILRKKTGSTKRGRKGTGELGMCPPLWCGRRREPGLPRHSGQRPVFGGEHLLPC